MFNSEMISLVGVAFWESIYMTIISSFSHMSSGCLWA